MGIEEKIDPVRPFDRSALVFHYSPSIAGDIHFGAEGIVLGVGGNGAFLGQEIPGKQDQPGGNHPRALQGIEGEESGLRLSRGGAAGGQSTVIPASICVAVPEVEFEKEPSAALPATALRTAAVTGGLHDSAFCSHSTHWSFGTAGEQEDDAKQEDEEDPGKNNVLNVRALLERYG